MRATALFAALLVAGILALAPRGLAELDYRRSARLAEAGDYGKAKELCGRALRRHPGHAKAVLLLEELAILEALRASDRVHLMDPPSNFKLALYDGRLAFSRGALVEARGELQSVLALGAGLPDSIDVRSRVEDAGELLRRIDAMLEDR